MPADGRGQVDAEACAKLFSRLWRLAQRYPGLNIELDMSRVCGVALRFVRELAFLRRHLDHPRRRVILTNVRPECAHLQEVFAAAQKGME